MVLEDFEENNLVTACVLLCLDYSKETVELITRVIDGLWDFRIIEETAEKEEEKNDNSGEFDNDDNNESKDDKGNEDALYKKEQKKRIINFYFISET